MVFFFMHEEEKLAVFKYENHRIESVVLNDKQKDRLPMMKLSSKSMEDKVADWIMSRGIPVTRQGITSELIGMGKKSTVDYMIDNLGLSLTDHYWICPKGSHYSWKSVNLYENDFKNRYTLDLKEDARSKAGTIRFVPSASLKGDLKKKWVIDHNGTRKLIKGNYKNDSNYYEAYLDYCACHGIDAQYMRDFMEYQILTDFLLTNTDRHFHNFGVLRDSKTFQLKKPAPIFDTGNGMFYHTNHIKTDYRLLNIKVTSFKEYEVELLKYVTNPRLVEIGKLPKPEEVYTLFKIDPSSTDEIATKLAKAYQKKIELLQEFQQGAKIYSYPYLKDHKVRLGKF